MIDKTFESFGVVSDYPKEKWATVRSILIWLLAVVITAAFDVVIYMIHYRDNGIAFLNVLLFQIPLQVNSVVTLNFMICIR